MTGDPRDNERTDFDARFAEIIAHFDDESPSQEPDARSTGSSGSGSSPAADSVEGAAATDQTDQTDRTEQTSDGAVTDRAAADHAGDVERPVSDPGQDEDRPTPSDPLSALPTQWRMPSTDEPPALMEDDGSYEPPAPAPLPAGDLHFWSIIATLVGGPLWLLYLFFFDRDAAAMWWVLACLASAAGVVLLVMRQPASREDDEEDDDGAVL